MKRRKSVLKEATIHSPHVQGAASFSKFMAVLQLIADAPGQLDISRLAKQAPYPRATIYRLVAALMAEGLVTQNAEDGTYRPGPRLLALASKTWESSDLRTIARSHLVALRDATDEVVHLAVPSNHDRMVYIDKIEGVNRVQMKTSIGAQVELHSTSVGKAWLSGLPEDKLQAILRSLDLKKHTVNTFTDPFSLLEELRRSRERGYAVDNEENEADILCIGSPIYNRAGEPVGTVSVSMPTYRHDSVRHRQFAKLVKDTAATISKELSLLP